jgi:hypothetical protein
MSAIHAVGGVAEERIGGSAPGSTLVTWVCGGCRHTSSVAGVYFVLLQKPTSIQFLTFATNQIRSIANFQKPIEGPGLSGGLSVSPDGRWILCTQVDQAGSELMLVENFH